MVFSSPKGPEMIFFLNVFQGSSFEPSFNYSNFILVTTAQIDATTRTTTASTAVPRMDMKAAPTHKRPAGKSINSGILRDKTNEEN